jgi:hypothetical protein
MRVPWAALLFLLLGMEASAQSRGFLGLEFAPVTRAAAARAPLLTTRGALIARVTADSSAAKAGIKPGEILARIDGDPVVSVQEAARTIRAGRAGEVITLTLFDTVRGDVHPRDKKLIFADALPVTRKLSVQPPRLVAKALRFPPAMVANAAWSRRIRGATEPLALVRLDAGKCSAFAPPGWKVFEARGNLFHAVSGDGRMRAIYKIVALSTGQARRPRRFATQLLAVIFGVQPQLSPSQDMRFGFHRFAFGTPNGVAGFVVYRLTAKRHLAIWIAAVPAGDVADLEPVAVSVVLSVRCASTLAPPAVPRPPHLVSTAISTRCLHGQCAQGDLAAAALTRFHKGYVHDADGAVFLVDPRRDLWAIGPQGPGYYRQNGGAVDKLEPGRTN